MDQETLRGEIVRGFDAMSEQFQAAARYVLDRPSDVALLSMREQARRAGVNPATMTRFAKSLGLPGYEDMRGIHAETLRAGAFAPKARAHVSAQKLRGDRALAAEVAASISAQVARFAEPEALDAIAAAGRLLSDARRVYCLGLRASHPAAWHLAYVLSLIGERGVHLDGAGATGLDALARADRRDALFAVSVSPYTRATIEAAEAAKAQGVRVVAVTDSRVAPLARLADEAILAPTDSPAFFHSMTSAFAAADILAAVVAGRSGARGVEALGAADAHFARLGVHHTERKTGAS